jgi:acetyl esterase/lipase
MFKLAYFSIQSVLSFLLISSSLFAQANTEKPPKTYADAAYGPHERHRLDFWQAPSDGPAPVVLYIHGGGYSAFSKDNVGADMISRCLAAGISVAAVNYRTTKTHTIPHAMRDIRYSLQFLRSKADAWNIDKVQIGATGGSAGGNASLWLATHDDMADPDDPDPVRRESTRLACAGVAGAQPTHDWREMDAWIPGGVMNRAEDSRFMCNAPGPWGLQHFRELNTMPMRALIHDLSAIKHITPDDPPIFMTYDTDNVNTPPEDTKTWRPWAQHHENMGYAFKGKLEAAGVPVWIQTKTASTKYDGITEFFIAFFGE